MTNASASPLQQRRTQLIVGSALLVLLASAVVQGLWTERWGGSGDLEQALARLEQMPRSAGPWSGKPTPFEPEQVEQARRVGIAGLLRQQFARPPGGAPVTAILMGGRFGPLSVHTPDICYGSAGYVVLGAPARVEFKCDDGSDAVFWTARFHKPNSPEVPALRIFWGWNASQGWQAPDRPRWTFRMKPVLYKLYAAREMASPTEGPEGDALAFLRTWLPELNKVLFPK
jgi:hypothetical protein